MAKKVALREFCHARSGNKGNDLNVGIAVYDPGHYQWIQDQLTEDVVEEYLEELTPGPVRRFELPRLGALNFLLPNILLGGHSGTPALDTLGKSLSSVLLNLEIDAPKDLADLSRKKGGTDPPLAGTEPKGQMDGGIRAGERLVRLGCGSAHAWDNVEAGLALAESGEVDYLIFDNMTEAIGDSALRRSRGERVWDLPNERRLRMILPACAATKTKIITNMGAADPPATAKWLVNLCRELRIPHLKVAAVVGDDVMKVVKDRDSLVEETGQPISSLGEELISANAYLSAEPVVKALRKGADVVVCGRIGDATQFLAPLLSEFDWPADDYHLLAKGLGIGHLMECGAQVTGGYFSDPPYKKVPDLHRVGFPIALVDASGDAVITKLPQTGGTVNRLTCLEQLLYEIGDPSAYTHTDAVVDFTMTEIREIGPDRVRITGTTGHPRPATVLVCLHVHEGYLGIGEISYGGRGAYERAQLGARIVAGRLASLEIDASKVRFDYEGINSLFAWKGVYSTPAEVRLRAAGVFATLDEAQMLRALVHELSCNGPSGGAGLALFPGGGGTTQRLALYRTRLPREVLQHDVIEI